MISDIEDLKPGHKGLLDVLEGAVLIIDPSGQHIIDANRRACIIVGMRCDELTNGSANEVFARSPMGGFEGLESMLSAGEGSLTIPRSGAVGPIRVEARSYFDGGAKRTMLTLERIDDYGNPALELDQLRKERCRAFRQLESEKRFADAIIDNAESLIIGMDMGGAITLFNRKAEQATGHQREEVLGKNYFSLFEKEIGPEGGKAWLADMVRGKGSVERIKVLTGKCDSQTIWWHNTIVESGDQLVMIGVGVDITERVSLNQRLEDLNQSLLLLNRIMRHDIMNDLSVALGSIQLFEMKREARFLEAAIRSLTKSVDLIHDTSDLERLRAPTELRSIKVREVIDKAVANRSGQNVVIQVSGESTALADETLSSVIDNLVGNAIMHGLAERVDIEIRQEKGHCLIRVADQGTGIPDEVKARVFDEGFKFGETGNTGLGLYIVKKTMERYGGSVVAMDNRPKGTVFELRLRLA
jgi:PAS domain S-box-containing protein